MLFNSYIFFAFFPCFLALYWLVRPSLTARNLLLIAGSYLFYCWWDWRFGALLLFTSLADYFFAGWVEKSAAPFRRKALVAASVGLNLGVLGFFKYFGFFTESLQALLNDLFQVQTNWHLLKIVLPVGISFYTFQSISYVIDVYRGKVPAARNLVQYLAFVSFFPQLVAGPIERASRMLPQYAGRLVLTAENMEHGLWLIIWGLFQKVVLADNLSPLVELAYDHATPSLPVLLLGTTAFALQIYCDFAGYSDMARGLAKLLGFELMINFNVPYVARTLRDFWQRWHISLSTWIRDYLYVPLGGNRLGESHTRANLLLAMLLAGLWHGAAANYVLWGIWHGAGLVVNRTWERLRPEKFALPAVVAWGVTMLFVGIGWMFFRASSMEQIVTFARAAGDFTLPMWWLTYVRSLLILMAPIMAVQLWQARRNEAESFRLWPRPARIVAQGILLLAINVWFGRTASPFIYFQF